MTTLPDVFVLRILENGVEYDPELIQDLSGDRYLAFIERDDVEPISMLAAAVNPGETKTMYSISVGIGSAIIRFRGFKATGEAEGLFTVFKNGQEIGWFERDHITPHPEFNFPGSIAVQESETLEVKVTNLSEDQVSDYSGVAFKKIEV